MLNIYTRTRFSEFRCRTIFQVWANSDDKSSIGHRFYTALETFSEFQTRSQSNAGFIHVHCSLLCTELNKRQSDRWELAYHVLPVCVWLVHLSHRTREDATSSTSCINSLPASQVCCLRQQQAAVRPSFQFTRALLPTNLQKRPASSHNSEAEWM